jgi:hypothetical protein
VAPPKPRRYDGSVDWLDRARVLAETSWTDADLEAVVAAFPYPPSRGVRKMDWVELIAATCLNSGEDPATCAERLALYATTYAERYSKEPHPAVIERTQA